MNDTMLGYGDRLLSAEICRSLGRAPDRPYATLDLRQVLSQGFPSPSRVRPTVIIAASSLRDYAWMKVADLDRQLQAYIQQGGHVLWIGGRHQTSGRLGQDCRGYESNRETVIASARTRVSESTPAAGWLPRCGMEFLPLAGEDRLARAAVPMEILPAGDG